MLKKNYEFKYVLKKGKFYPGKFIDIIICKNNMNFNLLGISISKKTANSVQRNRFKRLVRENYRSFENEILDGKSMIILCKKNIQIEDIKYAEIREDFARILKKANMYKEENK